MIEKYTKLFACVLPITSVLVFPHIQGTTLGLLMALFSPFVVLTTKKDNNRNYWHGIIVFIVICMFFFIASQLALVFCVGGITGNLLFIRPGPLEPMRITIFTQGLYLISGYFTFILFASYYNPSWDRFVIAGGVILATVGVSEWFYFLLTGNDFSFVSNRTFGEGNEGSGSLVQIITVMGRSVLRLKSLTGEPSMYALTAFPYMVFCFARRRFLLGLYLLVTLLLSTSTAALLGFLVFGLMVVFFYTEGLASKLMHFILLILCFVGLTVFFKDILVKMVLEKLMLENVSGADRFFNFQINTEYWLKSHMLIKMFGIGWGTIRSTDMAMTLLVNTGLFGLIAWLYFFMKPSIKVKRSDPTAFVLNLGMITVLSMLLAAVSEYSYLTTWLFLGILYNMTNENIIKNVNQNYLVYRNS